MPRGDGTGPAGLGPMTGRGAGYCAGYSTPGYANPVPGRGRGRGFGRGGGWGRRNWFYATGMPGWARAGYSPAWDYGPYQPMTPEQESDLLKNQAGALERELEAIAQRLEALEKGE